MLLQLCEDWGWGVEGSPIPPDFTTPSLSLGVGCFLWKCRKAGIQMGLEVWENVWLQASSGLAEMWRSGEGGTLPRVLGGPGGPSKDNPSWGLTGPRMLAGGEGSLCSWSPIQPPKDLEPPSHPDWPDHS